MTFFNSLWARIFLALGVVIMLVVVMSMLVATWSANREFDAFVVEVVAERAGELAESAEIEYNRTGDLRLVESLFDAHYAPFAEWETFESPYYDTDIWESIVARHEGSDEEAVQAIMRYELVELGNSADFDLLLDRLYLAQAFVYDPHNFDDVDSFYQPTDESQIFLADPQFNILYSSNGNNSDAIIPQNLRQYSVPVIDWNNNETVGYVFVEASADLADESRDSITSTLYTTVLGGLLTALFAFVIGAWLSRRISDPVQALTAAASRLAESGSTEQLPVNSTDELGQMSAAFNRMTRSLATQQQIRQRLIADISHELNTPLAIMRLEAQGMADGMQTPEEAAGSIQREIDLLHNLVNDLALIVETDRNAVSLHKEPVEVDLFLSEVVTRWRPKADVQGLQLQLVIADGTQTIAFDPIRMRQVLGNLLRNAIQHSAAGGQVVISAETSPTDLNLSIRDSGVGIAPDHLPFVFDRFYRVDEARQRVSGGRGLGLAIVKQLVGLHGGRVWATSEQGVGSTFFVSLPR
ncbi:MAG: sensor histidine kinase [Candidatus Promineifilaceae bacterium]